MKKNDFYCRKILLFFMLFFSTLRINAACGDSDPIQQFYAFQPHLIDNQHLLPFRKMASHDFFILSDKAHKPLIDTTFYEVNVDEWAAWVGAKVPKKDIRAILYHTPSKFFFAKLDSLSQKNIFVKTLLLHKKEGYEYLKFTKYCELGLSTKQTWGSTSLQERKALRQKLIKEAYLFLPKAKSNFVKLRLAYQLLKLYHYEENTKKVIETYKKYIEKQPYESWLRSSADFYYAQTYPSVIEKNYWYVKIFMQSKDKRVSCVEALTVDEKDSYEKTVALLKNNQEKAAFLTMLTLKNKVWESGNWQEIIKNIKKIYSLSPENKDIPFLITCEINDIEHELYSSFLYAQPYSTIAQEPSYDSYGIGSDGGSDLYIVSEAHKKRLKILEDFIKQISLEKKQSNTIFWLTAQAYLRYLQQDYEEAKKMAIQILKTPKTPENIFLQARLIRLLSNFYLYPQKTEIWEDEYIALQTENKLSPYLRLKIRDIFAKQWADIGAIPYSLMIGEDCWYYDFSSLYKGNHHISVYDKLLSILNQPKTNLEKYMVSNYGKNLQYYKIEVNLHKVTHFVRRDKLDSALAILQTIPKGSLQIPRSMQCNPFFVDWRNAHRPNKADKVQFTLHNFIERLVMLKQQVEKKPVKYANNYFLIGNAYFNMTQQGNYWKMWDSRWSSFPYSGDFTPFSDAYYGLSRAQKYYELGMQKIKNEKLARLCYFMTEQCHIYWLKYRKGREVDDFQPPMGKFKTQYLARFPHGKSHTTVKYWCQEYENIAYSFVDMCK